MGFNMDTLVVHLQVDNQSPGGQPKSRWTTKVSMLNPILDRCSVAVVHPLSQVDNRQVDNQVQPDNLILVRPPLDNPADVRLDKSVLVQANI